MAKKPETEILENAEDFWLGKIDKIAEDLDQMPVCLQRGSHVEDAVSTGLLTTDLILGGGWGPGRVGIAFGKESSAKSTLCYHTLKVLAKKGVRTYFRDPEGTMDGEYLGRIGLDVKSMFGVRDEKGKWLTEPIINYAQPDTGEDIYRFIHRALQAMPDKVMKNVDGEERWYFIMPDGTQHQAKDGRVQAVFMIDSLTAMLSSSQEEDDESKPMAQAARMHSVNLPLIKSSLRKKRCTLLAVNQVRLNPGTRYGNPEYETSGEAVKFYSDIRLRMAHCSSPETKTKSKPDEEACWDGNGIDRYIFTNIRTVKNKCFSPFRSSMLRVWIEEKGGIGRGIDPVWDTYQYLVETGQIDEGRGDKLHILLPGFEMDTSWKDFKALVLDPQNKHAIRNACRKQIKTSEAFQLYFDKAGSAVEPTAEDEKGKKGSMDLE